MPIIYTRNEDRYDQVEFRTPTESELEAERQSALNTSHVFWIDRLSSQALLAFSRLRDVQLDGILYHLSHEECERRQAIHGVQQARDEELSLRRQVSNRLEELQANAEITLQSVLTARSEV